MLEEEELKTQSRARRTGVPGRSAGETAPSNDRLELLGKTRNEGGFLGAKKPSLPFGTHKVSTQGIMRKSFVPFELDGEVPLSLKGKDF